ncbi:hypothetical protein N656DRAFT_412996 [Canariomyces notabilis]|uniref:Uncharacterized protein n=1 Tax=Canariomyces notabilis TaxID=2074819 RepID=A0AAN6T831_9PEZI|nr:hypothetical protein N656DRAFT_412996 [Canariomyces arenarius]
MNGHPSIFLIPQWAFWQIPLTLSWLRGAGLRIDCSPLRTEFCKRWDKESWDAISCQLRCIPETTKGHHSVQSAGPASCVPVIIATMVTSDKVIHGWQGHCLPGELMGG